MKLHCRFFFFDIWPWCLVLFCFPLNSSSLQGISSGRQSLSKSTTTDNLDSQRKGPIGVYVHIPYCRRRCRYCDFAIVPIGPHAATTAAEGKEEVSGFRQLDLNYTTALLKEVSCVEKTERILIDSIYFGGGTPSLAPIETLERILEALLGSSNGHFVLAEGAEITIEMDPGTFSKDKLKAVKDLGFNRISLGVQSFDDRILEAIGRVHRTKEIFNTLNMMKEVYGDELNYSLDLISGLPGLSLAAWAETLEKAASLEPRPSHLSLYDLQIERGTVFGGWYESEGASTRTRGDSPVAQILPLPSDEEASFMYKFASGYLRSKGFEHYEISSYARLNEEHQPSPWRSRHNQVYWDLNGQWYAFGLGATSYVGECLLARPRTLADYRVWADELSSSPSREMSEPLDDGDILTDAILKRLRTAEGLSLNWVRSRFALGEEYVKSICRGAELGMDLELATLDNGNNFLKLNDPNGFVFSNSIISSIFAQLETDRLTSTS